MELQNNPFILPIASHGKDYFVSESLKSLPPHSKSILTNFTLMTLIVIDKLIYSAVLIENKRTEISKNHI